MNRADADEYTQSLGQIVAGSWRQIALAKRLGVPKALGLTTEEWVNGRLGGYVKQSIPERRAAVAELTAEGQSQRGIAEVLGVDHATVLHDQRGENSPARKKKGKNDNGGAGDVGESSPPLSTVATLAATDAVRKAAETKAARDTKEQEREARREENRAKVAAVQPLESLVGRAKFATIVADPPWDWGDEGDEDQLGRARADYETWPLERLLTAPVGLLGDVDSHLYLWITNRSLPKGFLLLEQWDFRYVTTLTWAKPTFGMGNYFRGQSEHLLFGVRGSQPLKRKDIGTVVQWPRGSNGHSSKPHEVYGLVESCSPGPYLELFSRGVERDGWTMWGERSA